MYFKRDIYINSELRYVTAKVTVCGVLCIQSAVLCFNVKGNAAFVGGFKINRGGLLEKDYTIVLFWFCDFRI